MEKLVTISRYSNNAFYPKHQSHHLKLIDYHLHGFSVERFPKHIRAVMLQQHVGLKRAYLENREKVRYGVWCFFAGHEDFNELSHLTYTPKLYKARIPAETVVYSQLLNKSMPLTCDLCKETGFFLPECSLGDIRDEWQVDYRTAY